MKARAKTPFLEDEEEDIPYEAVYPDVTPGTVIRGLRYRDGLTQQALAKLADIPERHIWEAVAVACASRLTDSDSGSVEWPTRYPVAVSIRSFLRRNGWSMENGKRPIGKQNAHKLAAAFKADARMFLFA